MSEIRLYDTRVTYLDFSTEFAFYLKVVDSGFFLGGCVQGTCRVPHPKGVLSQTPLQYPLRVG